MSELGLVVSGEGAAGCCSSTGCRLRGGGGRAGRGDGARMLSDREAAVGVVVVALGETTPCKNWFGGEGELVHGRGTAGGGGRVGRRSGGGWKAGAGAAVCAAYAAEATAGRGLANDEDVKFMSARWMSGSLSRSELFSSVPQWMRSTSFCLRVCACVCVCACAAASASGAGAGSAVGLDEEAEVERLGRPIAARLSALPEIDCCWRSIDCRRAAIRDSSASSPTTSPSR